MPGYLPLLAILTGLFEAAAAVFALLSPGRKRILHPVALLLLLLAGYQFAEVAVCSSPGRLLFARVAFFDITWLPPAGLWLLGQLAWLDRKGWRWLSLGYFAAGAALILWILVDPAVITKSVCQLVVARYWHPAPFETAYALFYQFGLLLLVVGAGAGLVKSPDAVSRAHLFSFQLGLLGFLLPSMYIRSILREPDGVIPSVMCHFALILAVCLTTIILRERKHAPKTS
jgi:hypothetical protein